MNTNKLNIPRAHSPFYQDTSDGAGKGVSSHLPSWMSNLYQNSAVGHFPSALHPAKPNPYSQQPSPSPIPLSSAIFPAGNPEDADSLSKLESDPIGFIDEAISLCKNGENGIKTVQDWIANEKNQKYNFHPFIQRVASVFDGSIAKMQSFHLANLENEDTKAAKELYGPAMTAGLKLIRYFIVQANPEGVTNSFVLINKLGIKVPLGEAQKVINTFLYSPSEDTCLRLSIHDILENCINIARKPDAVLGYIKTQCDRRKKLSIYVNIDTFIKKFYENQLKTHLENPHAFDRTLKSMNDAGISLSHRIHELIGIHVFGYDNLELCYEYFKKLCDDEDLLQDASQSALPIEKYLETYFQSCKSRSLNQKKENYIQVHGILHNLIDKKFKFTYNHLKLSARLFYTYGRSLKGEMNCFKDGIIFKQRIDQENEKIFHPSIQLHFLELHLKNQDFQEVIDACDTILNYQSAIMKAFHNWAKVLKICSLLGLARQKDKVPSSTPWEKACAWERLNMAWAKVSIDEQDSTRFRLACHLIFSLDDNPNYTWDSKIIDSTLPHAIKILTHAAQSTVNRNFLFNDSMKKEIEDALYILNGPTRNIHLQYGALINFYKTH